jgi:hypothetical protein
MTPIAPSLLLAEIALRQQRVAEDYRRANARGSRRFHVRRPAPADRVS